MLNSCELNNDPLLDHYGLNPVENPIHPPKKELRCLHSAYTETAAFLTHREDHCVAWLQGSADHLWHGLGFN